MPTGEPGRAHRPSRRNLYRVSLIRVILLTVLLAMLLWARFSGAVALPWLPVSILLIAMALLNALILLRLRWRRPVSETEFFGNLLLDVGFLTALLFLTGGSTNPLVSYYLIPLIISAAVLRPRYTWAIAVLAVACYTFLLFRFVPLDLFAMPGHGSAMGAHFLGMWISFAFSAVLIAGFVVRMAVTMR
ncbi:MAG: sensor histidine kinase, partial [Xanthomonadales bacterium]|nr:sensor histidine kinase [Xanthomonadales bacterium]